MAYFDSMKISASGMTAQRVRADIIAQNLANVKTTRAADGKPYRRQTVLFETLQRRQEFKDILTNFMGKQANGGVKAARIVQDRSPLTCSLSERQCSSGNDGFDFGTSLLRSECDCL